MAPLAHRGDSTDWRGDVEPLAAAAATAASPAIARRIRALLLVPEEDRDPRWYYLPGRWTLHSDGRCRYLWKAQRGGVWQYTVEAERLSADSAN